MKTKFTLLIAFSLLFVFTSQAQNNHDRGYQQSSVYSQQSHHEGPDNRGQFGDHQDFRGQRQHDYRGSFESRNYSNHRDFRDYGRERRENLFYEHAGREGRESRDYNRYAH